MVALNCLGPKSTLILCLEEEKQFNYLVRREYSYESVAPRRHSFLTKKSNTGWVFATTYIQDGNKKRHDRMFIGNDEVADINRDDFKRITREYDRR